MSTEQGSVERLAHTYGPQTLRSLLRRHAADYGWLATARECGEFGLRLARGGLWALAGGHGSFVFQGETYPYLYHRRHPSWLNERAVEVPIAHRLVQRHAGARILEVGNVLGLYGPRDHLVVDKYEHAPGVLNIDALDIRDARSYDLVVSISTIEHIGWDEHPQDPERAPRAIEHLASLLAPGGTFMFTVPGGYNPHLDRALAAGEVPLARLGALRRDGRRTCWHEISPEAAWAVPYDDLFYAANAVLVGIVTA
jgi:SAM-dependent methyltransferase